MAAQTNAMVTAMQVPVDAAFDVGGFNTNGVDNTGFDPTASPLK